MHRETLRPLSLSLACVLLFCALFSLASPHSSAADFKLSGFGTLGYAWGDQNFPYLRYIDTGGSFRGDTLFGLQGDAQFNSQWSTTVQAVASAPRTRDNGVETKFRWAFVSYRPNNDWLFRVGRVRPPFFLNSQNAEVGVTYDQVRLPPEFYSFSPAYDIDGGIVTKTWSLEKSELNLDAYMGNADIKFRLFSRDTDQPMYISDSAKTQGLILSYTTGSLLLRGGANRLNIYLPDQPIPKSYDPNPIPGPSPFGGTLYLPSSSVSKFNITLLTVGADWRAADWRVTGEFAKRITQGTIIADGGWSAYATLARQIGKWTPYVTHARTLSDSDTRANYSSVNGTPVPLAVQAFPPFLSPNFHRSLADTFAASDQYSNMVGASYSFSATSKLKVEWMQTHVGLVSNTLVDGDVHNQRFNVFSVSYSMAF